MLERIISKEHSFRSQQKDSYVEPDRASPNVSKIQAHHLVEPHATTSVDLPQPSDPGLYFEDAPTMPQVVLLALIGQWRSWSDKRHVAFQYIDELR